jgi:hypothetical protein
MKQLTGMEHSKVHWNSDMNIAFIRSQTLRSRPRRPAGLQHIALWFGTLDEVLENDVAANLCRTAALETTELSLCRLTTGLGASLTFTKEAGDCSG